MKKTFAVISMILVIIAVSVVPAYACTGIYVGPETSADGTTIIA